MRDSLQAQRWLAYTVIGVLALVFAAWGAYGIVDLSIGSGDYAAKVEGEKVSVQTAQEAWQRQQMQWAQRFGGDLPDELKPQLQEQLLEGLVRDALLGKHSRDLGYRVSDAQLHEQIRTLPAFQLDGRYSPDVARYALTQAGMTEQQFEATLRRDLERGQIETGIRVSDFVTPNELKRMQALQLEQREVRYAVLPADKYAASAVVDDAAVQAYYTKNQSRFMTPEYVQLAYAELRLDQLASQIVVSDEDLKAEYEKSKDAYTQPEKRHVRHILIDTGKDDAAALKKAESVLADAKAGKDFAELARSNSQDPGSSANGGDLGWIERANFDPAFADAAFSMTAGEIRGPVKSQFGYHIIKVEEVAPGTIRTFEDARAEIESQVRRNRAAERFGDVEEQIQQKVDQRADLEAIAREFGLQTGEVAQFQRGKGGEPLGDSPELEEAVFSNAVLDEKRVGGPVPVGEDRIVIVKALKHEQATPMPLETVRDEIVASIRQEHGTEAAANAAEAAREKLAAGTSFDDVAKELGVIAEPARFVGRDDPSVPAAVRDTVFSSPKPDSGKSIVRTAKVENGSAVLAVSAVRADASAPPELLDQQRVAMLSRRGVGDSVAYQEELRRTADVSKNPKAFE